MRFDNNKLEAILAGALILLSVCLLLPVGWNTIKLLREYRQLKGLLDKRRKSFAGIFRRWSAGWTHESTILAVPGDYLRNVDGSYTAAFIVEPGNTLFMTPEELNRIYTQWSEVLGREERYGLIYQIRATNHIDQGEDYVDFLKDFSKKSGGTLAENHYLASSANTLNRLQQGDYRKSKISIWVKVPIKEKGDREMEGVGAYWKVFKESFSTFDFLKAWTHLSELSSNNIVRRLTENEEKARSRAEKIFRGIESQAPTSCRRLKKEMLKTAIYMGHNESARASANLGDSLKDLRPFLGGETIAYGDEIIWHANTPIALMTLTNAPGADTQVGIMRTLTCNPELNFRYTVITDFIPMTNAKAERKLKTNIKRISRQIAKSKEKKSVADDNPAARKNLDRLIAVREKLGEPSTRLMQTRVSILIYAAPVASRDLARNAAKFLEEVTEQTLSVIRKMPGADAVRESGVHLPNLYPNLIVGELSAKLNGRELDGECRDMLTLAPFEGHWHGTGKTGETWIENLTGELIPLTFFRPSGTSSPVAYIIAGAGGGKSFFIGKEIRNWLAYFKKSKCIVVDFGGSYEWLARALGGSVFRFTARGATAAKAGRRNEAEEDDVLTYNIWWYPGLEEGELPDDAQIELVVREILKLSGTRIDSSEAPVRAGLIRKFVRRVYENTVPRNRPDLKRSYEPRLSDFCGVLENYPIEREPEIQKAWTDLKLTLQQWRGNRWLDAVTSPVLKENNRFVIYDLDTLKEFPDQVREVLAFRVAAAVLNSELMKVDGNYVHTLKVFDEMHNHARDYPMMIEAIDIAGRQDRKKMGAMLLASHSFKDVRAVRGATTNAAIKIAGQQNSTNLHDDSGEKTDFKALVDDMGLTTLAVEEIKHIRGGGKSFREFLIKIETGGQGEIGFLRNDSSPLDYWCLTTSPEEVNVRRLVFELVENILGTDQTFNYLATRYPFGLPDGEKFDDSELRTLAERYNKDNFDAEINQRFLAPVAETATDSPPIPPPLPPLPPVRSNGNGKTSFNSKDNSQTSVLEEEAVLAASPYDDWYGEQNN